MLCESCSDPNRVSLVASKERVKTVKNRVREPGQRLCAVVMQREELIRLAVAALELYAPERLAVNGVSVGWKE